MIVRRLWRRSRVQISRIVILLATFYLVGTLVRYIWFYWLWRWLSLYREWRIDLGACRLRTAPFIRILDGSNVLVSWITSCPEERAELLWQCIDDTPIRVQHRFGGGGRRFQNNATQPSTEQQQQQHRNSGISIESINYAHSHHLARTILPNLSPGTTCTYQLVLGGVESHRGSFRMPHQAIAAAKSTTTNTPITIGLIGDSQFGSAIFYQLMRQIYQRKPHLFGHLGDMVQFGDRMEEWNLNFFDPVTWHWPVCSETVCFAIQGNHDLASSFRPTRVHPFWQAPFTINGNSNSTFTAFTVGHARLILLNTNEETETQVRWLEQELASPASQRASFRILLSHIPPFIEFWDPATWFEGGESYWPVWMRTRILPLLERGHVDLVVSGHQHNYQRGFRGGVHYVVAGGGGGELDRVRVHDHQVYRITRFQHHYVWLEVSQDELVLTAHGLGGGGGVIDRLRIPRATVRKFKPSEYSIPNVQ